MGTKVGDLSKLLRGTFLFVLWCVNWYAVAMLTRFCNTVFVIFVKIEKQQTCHGNNNCCTSDCYFE